MSYLVWSRPYPIHCDWDPHTIQLVWISTRWPVVPFSLCAHLPHSHPWVNVATWALMVILQCLCRCVCGKEHDALYDKAHNLLESTRAVRVWRPMAVYGIGSTPRYVKTQEAKWGAARPFTPLYQYARHVPGDGNVRSLPCVHRVECLSTQAHISDEHQRGEAT